MAFSKVTLNGDTLMDVTQKTVTAATMLSGTTALKNDGTDVTGNIPSKSSGDLTVNGATVTAPAGHYASSASKSVATGTATTPATTITANPNISVDVGPSKNLLPYENGDIATASGLSFTVRSDGGINISGTTAGVSSYNCYMNTSNALNLAAGSYRFLLTGNGTGYDNVSIQLFTDTGSGMANRYNDKDFTYIITSDVLADHVRVRCTAGVYDCVVYPMVMDSNIIDTTFEPYGLQATVSATVSASQSVTPTISAGYVLSGTAGTVSVSGSSKEHLATQAAETYHPSTTDQTITSGKYLTGVQTIKAVTITNLTAENIADGVTVKIGDSVDDDCVASITGTYSGGTTPASPKDVNFIDYDGTILYSYTKSEFAQLTALPANPSHSGDDIPLTSQGWNWTLAQINAQLTAQPNGPVTVGQMYVTTDGKTYIEIELYEGRLSPYLGIAVNGTVVVDWGDNSASSTVTGSSLTTQIRTLHEYAAAGRYKISISVSSGSFAFYGTTTYTLLNKNSSTANQNCVYSNTVQSVQIGNNASIGSYAFYYCYSLASITIPSGVTSIASSAFRNCYSLASITIPNGVTSIGSTAFQNCYSLASITIPSGVTSIASSAFAYCYSLASITIPSGVTSIGDYAFYNCYSLASIIIPSGVTSIASSAFRNCYSLASITIPSGVTSIASSAFRNCYSLASITIPSGVTSIGDYAFQNCYSLASIIIPSGVTSIGSYAFYYCYGFAKLRFLPTTPPTVANSNAFTNIPTDCVISVPTGKKSAYTGATNYPSSSTYTYIEE